MPTQFKKLNTTLLYVEDDDSIRENMFSLLQRRIDKVLLAENGEKAYEKFLEEKPEIIVTDILMPKLNGIELAEKIKYDFPDTSIIIMSAFNDYEYLFKSIHIGVTDYILKPTDFNKLFSAITKCEGVHALKKENEILKAKLTKLHSLLSEEETSIHILKNKIQEIIA
ncbi:MAG: response regulator [Leptospiraceae bacterium]|nr:response regulator [Leptospiraceae bacterium]